MGTSDDDIFDYEVLTLLDDSYLIEKCILRRYKTECFFVTKVLTIANQSFKVGFAFTTLIG